MSHIIETNLKPQEPQPLHGIDDFSLYNAFKREEIQHGTEIEITTDKILPDKDGKGARVILLFSAAYRYYGKTGTVRFEHLVLSEDERIESMRLKGVNSWHVIGPVSPEQLDRMSSEIAESRS